MFSWLSVRVGKESARLYLFNDSEKRTSSQELLSTHLFDNTDTLIHALVRSLVSKVEAQSSFLKQNAFSLRARRSLQPTIISPTPKHTSAKFILLY